MSGTIIENWTNRKLIVFVGFLLITQVACFLVGCLIAHTPLNAQNILGTVCKDTSTVKNDTMQWFYNRGKGKCKVVDLLNLDQDVSETDVVFAFQMPVPRDSMVLEYSRWQQNLIGVLQIDVRYHPRMEITSRSVVTIDARLAYRNKGEPEDQWTLYTESVVKRDCDIQEKIKDYLYDSTPIPLFELGSLHHDYYLLNIRLPVDTPDMNANIGFIQDIWLTVINQNEGFTKVWLSLKTVFFPCILATVLWFWIRLSLLQRKLVLVEKLLTTLGVVLCVLNLPIEYLTLQFDLPIIFLLEDVRQGMFYAVLYSFWLVFAGEHMLIQDVSRQSSLKQYSWQLTAVVLGCIIFLFAPGIHERSEQLRNQFYTIWATHLGTNLALILCLTAVVLTLSYFVFLCYLLWNVFINLDQKREEIIFRFKLLVLTTLLCAALTVIAFILLQITKFQWVWDNIQLKYTAGFFTGVYGMWNLYVFALLVLYAPNHKDWVTETTANKNEKEGKNGLINNV